LNNIKISFIGLILLIHFNVFADSILKQLEGSWYREDLLNYEPFGFHVSRVGNKYVFQVDLNLYGGGYFVDVSAIKNKFGKIIILYPNPRTRKKIPVVGLKFIDNQNLCIEFVTKHKFEKCNDWKFIKVSPDKFIEYWEKDISKRNPYGSYDPDRGW
jgi:hypothetical protein